MDVTFKENERNVERERGTSARLHPVAPIALLTQGIAHCGRAPIEACPATRVRREDATRSTSFIVAG
jgi:hypothetical protein